LSEEEESSSKDSSDVETSSKRGDSSYKELSNLDDDDDTTLIARIENLKIKLTNARDKEETAAIKSQQTQSKAPMATTNSQPPQPPE
jgi:hypothetical protein